MCGHHDHRDALAHEFTQQIHAIAVRQAHIEQHQVRHQLASLVAAFGQRLGMLAVVSGLLQPLGDCAAEQRFIFDNEDARLLTGYARHRRVILHRYITL